MRLNSPSMSQGVPGSGLIEIISYRNYSLCLSSAGPQQVDTISRTRGVIVNCLFTTSVISIISSSHARMTPSLVLLASRVHQPDNLGPRVSSLIGRLIELIFVSRRQTTEGLAHDVVSITSSLCVASFSPLTFHDKIDKCSLIGNI